MNEKVNKVDAGKRLDLYLVEYCPQYSRSSLAKLIESGSVSVNNNIKKSRYILKNGDIVNIDLSYLKSKPDIIKLPIIFEDENILVIDKPSGVLTHSKGDFNKEGTVATFIQPYLNGDDEWKRSNRAGIVHRLDRGTSGIIVCAKNKATQDYLQGQFSKRNIKKVYLAVTTGQLNEDHGSIDIPIERNPKKPSTFRAGINGKSAQTEFEVIKVKQVDSKTFSVLKLKPITGRTHQLRVHLAYLKHPILGDDYYDGNPHSRLMLHALSIELTMHGGERRTFESDLPSEFKEFISG